MTLTFSSGLPPLSLGPSYDSERNPLLSNSDADSQFLQNLQKTLGEGKLIRSDGAELTFWDRIVDSIFCWQRHDHFLVVCQRFSELGETGEIKDLTYDQSSDLAGGLLAIARKLKNPAIKDECVLSINTFSTKALVYLPRAKCLL